MSFSGTFGLFSALCLVPWKMEENKGVPKFRLYLFFVFFVLEKLKIVSQPDNCLEFMSGVSCILFFK